jgi:hypothetical protein
MGALTSLTWGIFGLLTGGAWSAIASALIGAAWGGGMAYREGHHTSDAQLAVLGRQLPADSSALLVFAETRDAPRLLAAPGRNGASAVSVAAIADDLTAHVFTGSADAPVEVPRDQAPHDEPGRLSMIVIRYPHRSTAKAVAARITASEKTTGSPQVELVVDTDASGRRHVTDHKLGAAAVAKYNIVSYGVLGLVCGAISGVTGGDGLLDFLEGGLVTGVAYGLFGVAAGALYGLWAGRSISARRLKGIAPILKPGTSLLVAWGETPLNQDTRGTLAPALDARLLILGFNPTQSGAVLEVT